MVQHYPFTHLRQHSNIKTDRTTAALGHARMHGTYRRLARVKRGFPPKKAGTASSMMLWPFTKLSVVSGNAFESEEHLPGRGDGSLILATGSQFELAVS